MAMGEDGTKTKWCKIKKTRRTFLAFQKEMNIRRQRDQKKKKQSQR